MSDETTDGPDQVDDAGRNRAGCPAVLDASAVLAWLQDEPGAGIVAAPSTTR